MIDVKMTGKKMTDGRAEMTGEVYEHLINGIIPFWRGLRDDENGGYYGYMSYDLTLDKKAVKGGILNSRILWFFSSAYTVLKNKPSLPKGALSIAEGSSAPDGVAGEVEVAGNDAAIGAEAVTGDFFEGLLGEARHAYEYLRDIFFDKEKGGIYWSVSFDGTPVDTTKHTYAQAFAIYGLAAYYEASRDDEALRLAFSLYELIEKRMRDEGGYLEAFDRDFAPVSNEKLSENGVEAARSMNTLLHVMEAYTKLYQVSNDARVRQSLYEILDIAENKIWNPDKRRQEVFFDLEYNSLIDLYSYGHDIEAAWLINLTVDTLGDEALSARLDAITAAMAENVYREAFDGESLPAEAERGIVKEDRVWWVQAECVNGFFDAYLRAPAHREYLEAAEATWAYIRKNIIDPREGSEWYSFVEKDGTPGRDPIVEPWKCPYHNGRMCLEVIKNAA